MKLKIKDRLTFTSSIIFGVVFALTASLVYFMFYETSQKLIVDQLRKTANISAVFYLEEDELPQKEHRKVKEEYRKRVAGLNAEVRVYDEFNDIAYGEEKLDDLVTVDFLNKVRDQGSSFFNVKNLYYYGIFYPDNQGDFVVLVKDNQDFFHEQSRKIAGILVLVFLGGILAIIILSKLLSNIAYKPVNEIVDQVNALSADSLNKPIQSAGTHDEVQRLTDTFNDLLYRLSQNFAMQKNFINYFSHEVRTPLTSISGNIQVFGDQNQPESEFVRVKQNILSDIDRIEDIMNALMVVSGLKKDTDGRGVFRIDELIWDTMELINKSEHKKQINVNIDIPASHQSALNVEGNKSQIKIALINIVENALKFSRVEKVELEVTHNQKQTVLTITDYGMGIPQTDLNRITEPFFRASNTEQVKGSGMGLAVASLILKHNNAVLEIESEQDKFTRVTLRLKQAF